ncbi:MAG TPA: hypothetical protein VKN18_03740 [Blastocatellia bacterium]|nr:hypothetical protein [Blastocatellia bacterium]
MLQVNRLKASALALVLALAIPCAADTGRTKESGPGEAFDPVEFIKSFRMGMSYDDVQKLLPKSADQDTLAYIPSEESFLLGVDIKSQATWSVSFKFDTQDTPARRPEQLIELSCSAGFSSRGETFETIVRKVTEAFGDPVELDRSQEKFQLAGWRVSGGSVLTLEYSITGSTVGNVNIEFVIRKNRSRSSSDTKTAA